MASLEPAIGFVAAVLLAIVIFTITTKRQPTSLTAAGASFAIGISALPTLIGFMLWRDALIVLITRGLAYLASFNDSVIGFPFLLAPFVLSISIGVFLSDRKRQETSHLAIVPLGVGMAVSVVGTVIFFFLAMILSAIAEA